MENSMDSRTNLLWLTARPTPDKLAGISLCLGFLISSMEM